MCCSHGSGSGRHEPDDDGGPQIPNYQVCTQNPTTRKKTCSSEAHFDAHDSMHAPQFQQGKLILEVSFLSLHCSILGPVALPTQPSRSQYRRCLLSIYGLSSLLQSSTKLLTLRSFWVCALVRQAGELFRILIRSLKSCTCRRYPVANARMVNVTFHVEISKRLHVEPAARVYILLVEVHMWTRIAAATAVSNFVAVASAWQH